MSQNLNGKLHIIQGRYKYTLERIIDKENRIILFKQQNWSD